MANDDAISARGGLLPVNYPYGNFRKTIYKLTTSAVAVYIGQPMDLDSTGGVVPCGISGTSPLIGSVVGFIDTDKAGLPSGMTSLSQGAYLPALTNAYVVICDDPNQDFMIQEDTGGAALSIASNGCTFFMVPRTSSGNTTTGYSTFELDRSTVTFSSSGQLLLKGLVDYMNSDGTTNDYGNYAKLKVQIFRHRLAPLAGGPI